MTPPQCATCPRPVTAGYKAGTHAHVRCLICTTARLMKTFRDPVAARRGAKEDEAIRRRQRIVDRVVARFVAGRKEGGG